MATNRPRLTSLKPRLVALKSGPRTLTGSTVGWRTEGMGSTERGYTYRWQKESKAFLREHPLCECEECQAGELRVTTASVVDHHIPHRGDQALFWDRRNWRAMAKACHDRKTQRETAAEARALR
jgi:5-methylcytosine-specific restriction protein A